MRIKSILIGLFVVAITTGQVATALTGNRTNSGTFTAGTGRVDFTAGEGITQTLTVKHLVLR